MRYYYDPHYTDEETKAEVGSCPKVTQLVLEVGYKPRQSDWRSSVVCRLSSATIILQR